MTFRRCLNIAAAALLIAFAASSGMAVERALLIGVEKHANEGIPRALGAAEDARALARVVELDFGFDPDGIRLLLNEDATAAAIETTFTEWLVEGTAPGDRVFFFFSGHGSRIPDDNGDEADGLDEALVAFDSDPGTGANEIRDDLLDALVATLSGRRAVVVFDAAAAGQVMAVEDAGSAGVPTARYLPGPSELAGLEAARAWTLTADASSSEGFLDRPTELGQLSGILVASAARPGQLAHSIDVEGSPRGAFSFVFESLYGELDRVDPAAAPEGTRGLLGKVGKRVTGTLGSAVKSAATSAVPGTGLTNRIGTDIVGTVAQDAVSKAEKKLPEGISPSAPSYMPAPSKSGSAGSGSREEVSSPGTTAGATRPEDLEVSAAAVGGTGPGTEAAAPSSSPAPSPVAQSPPPTSAPVTATAPTTQTISVGNLPAAMDSGMQHLAASGVLPAVQDPWFEVLSEEALEPQPLFGDWQQAAAVALKNPMSTAEVSLVTGDGRSTYAAGDALEFEITSDREGFLYLLIFSEQQVATCIFPNPDDPDNAVEAGTIRLPGSRDYFFPVQEPFGTDVVVALVSETRLDLCDRMTYSWDEVYAKVDLSGVQNALRLQSARGVGVQPGTTPKVEGDGWQTANMILTTTER